MTARHDVSGGRTKGPRYTPVSKRQDKPDAVAWFIRNHPEVSDAQISKTIGTTKSTINNVRDKSHWNSQNIRPVDPVTLGLCTQIELDEVIAKSADKRRRIEAEKGLNAEGPGLVPTQDDAAGYEPEKEERQKDVSAADVFRDFS
mgnify:FL=1